MPEERPLAIVDLDGVVADVRHRLHHLRGRRKDWDAFFGAAAADLVHPEGAAIVATLAAEHEVVFLTGRPAHLRAATQHWLDEHGFGAHRLVMRPGGDRRPAAVLKIELVRELADRPPHRHRRRRRRRRAGGDASGRASRRSRPSGRRRAAADEAALQQAQEDDGAT